MLAPDRRTLPNSGSHAWCAPLLAACLLTACVTARSPGDTVQASACPLPVTPSVYPHPDYPEYEARNGYEDSCLVRFDVDSAGAPVNPQARCTYRAFSESAEAAMLDARFDPSLSEKLPAGAQCAGFNFEYTLEPDPESP